MDITYGKPVESVRRFTLFKWATAAVLVAILLAGWLTTGPGEGRVATPGTVIEEAPPGGLAASRQAAGQGEAAEGAGGPAPTTSTTTAAGRTPATFAIERAADGAITVSGTVDNEVTRDQWLNAIRIGAQGTPVRGRFEVGDVAAAPDWAGQLSSLVAVMRENRITTVRVEGDRVVLRGTLGSAAEKASAEQVMQAQLPSGYRLESRLATGPVAAAGAASPGGSEGEVDKPGAAAGKAVGESGPGAGAGAEGGAGPQKSAAVADPEPVPAKTPSKSVSCPKRVRSLAQSVYFRTDSASLPSKDFARLERLGACLGRHSVRIIGHADPRHTDDYNVALSRRRAQAVAQALTAGGAPEERLTVVAAGRTSDKTTSRAAMQRARRVDIILR